MKKILLTAAVLLLFLKPVFANHGVEALGVLAYIFVAIIAALVLGIVFSIIAFRTNKTVWKILAVIPTVATLVGGFMVLSVGEVVWLGYAIMALGVMNTLLIANARNRTAKPDNVAAR